MLIQKEIISALAYIIIYLLIFLFGETMRKHFPEKHELSRKAVHFLSGLVAMSFPYFIRFHWTVFVLALSFLLIVVIARQKGFLESVHGVKRKTYGAIYYPIAVYLIFLMAANRPAVYLTSILVMTASDTFAALIGTRYGGIKFEVEGSLKSLEGSIVFFFITFLCIHLPLLLVTDTARIDSVLIAFIIAVLVTGFESISLSGIDNIIVPFGTYFLLMKMTKLPHPAVANSLYFLLGVIVITAFLTFRMRLFKASGLIAVMLLNYAALSLCNVYWFVPLLLAQVFYYFLIKIYVHYESIEKVKTYQVKVVFYLGILPTLLIFAANVSSEFEVFYLPYLTSVVAQMLIISSYFFSEYLKHWANARSLFKRYRKILEIIFPFLASLCITLIPILFYKRAFIFNSAIVVVSGAYIAYMFDLVAARYFQEGKDDIFEYRRRFMSVVLGVGSVFLLQNVITL